MPRIRPDYFDRVRQKAQDRWDQLERDPELAGPWRQMFIQVKNPRHVLSELLQNADDAGATWVHARLTDDGVFLFEHNGGDFDENSLASLCGFASSNKRQLHTIGFRGLGFKSTFSYGPRVEVVTPSLAFYFDESRFTQPHWMEDVPPVDAMRIRIKVKDPQIMERIRDDLRGWSESGVPLLFFSNIQRLQLQDELIEKEPDGAGPIPGSEWLQLRGRKSHRVLRVVSGEEAFPEEALAEVRAERNEQEFDLPPCRVEIILGLPGEQRLYAVLPTEVRPQLPFSCNAPFIQDPARNGIKDPVASPTNRWLLTRIGQTAARAMLAWLDNAALPMQERARAYDLLPVASADGDSLAQVCTRAVLAGFRPALGTAPLLLATDGTLSERGACLGAPVEVLDVWAPNQALAIFGPTYRDVVAREVTSGVRSRLEKWEFLDLVTPKRIVERLLGSPPPRPARWEQVAALWAYLETHWRQDFLWTTRLHNLKIVPVRGLETLQAPNAVMVLGKRDADLDAGDWNFLEDQVCIMDPAWQEFLERHAMPDAPDAGSAYGRRAVTLRKLAGLDQQARLQQVFDSAVHAVFQRPDPGERGLRLARIAATADLSLPDGFRYLCRDGVWRSVGEGLLAELTTELETLLPPEWVDKRLIASDYQITATRREHDRWVRWLRSGKSRLATFPLPRPTYRWLRGRQRALALIQERGGDTPPRWYYQKQEYRADDYDFDPVLWEHWEMLAAHEADIWSHVVREIARAWSPAWDGATRLRVLDWHASNASHALACGSPRSAWLHRLAGLPCLPDQFGGFRRPAELLRRSNNTERLYQLKVAPFLRDDFQRSEFDAFFRHLGVRDQLTEAGTLLTRLKALAASPNVPPRLLEELINLYRALDQIWFYLPGSERSRVLAEFRKHRLILSDRGEWRDSRSIYQRNDAALPGLPVIHPEAAGLTSLWDVLEAPRQPTLDLALQWLKEVPRHARLEESDRTLVRSLLAREPARVIAECGAWLDLAGCWTPLADLRWTSRGSREDLRLFAGVRRHTADLSMLPADLRPSDLFDTREPLEAALQLKLARCDDARAEAHPAWLVALTQGLRRLDERLPSGVEHADGTVPPSNRAVACQLDQAEWWRASKLEATPYLAGEPAGEPLTPKALWQGDRLYVVGCEYHYTPALAEALADRFTGEPVRQAIRFCVARDPDFVRHYLEEHLPLLPEPIVDEEDAIVERGATGPVVGLHEPRDRGPESETGSDETEGPDLIGTGPGDPPALGPSNGGGPDEGRKHPLKVAGASRKSRDYLATVLEPHGFRWNTALNLFVDGRERVVRKDGIVFPWVYYEAGIPVAQYWVGTRPLDQGLEIPAAVWQGLRDEPEKSWLVLPCEEGSVSSVAYQGISLINEQQTGRLELNPSSYYLSRSASATTTLGSNGAGAGERHADAAVWE